MELEMNIFWNILKQTKNKKQITHTHVDKTKKRIKQCGEEEEEGVFIVGYSLQKKKEKSKTSVSQNVM